MFTAAGWVVIVIVAIAALVWVHDILNPDNPDYICKCREGFRENPHDDRCVVCRGWED